MIDEGLSIPSIALRQTFTAVAPKVRGFYVTEDSSDYGTEDGLDTYVNALNRAYMIEASGIYTTENAASNYVTENRS